MSAPTQEPTRTGPLSLEDVQAANRARRRATKAARPWWRKKRLLLPVGFVALVALAGHGGSTTAKTAPAKASTSASVAPAAVAKPSASAPSPAAPSPAAVAQSAAPVATFSQRQALRSAKQYLSMGAFSRAGLIDQLSSSAGEGFSVADATYAADNSGADWNAEAAKAAKSYLSMQGFSRAGLIQQLDSSAGDQYTPAQAAYGVAQAGL